MPHTPSCCSSSAAGLHSAYSAYAKLSCRRMQAEMYIAQLSKPGALTAGVLSPLSHPTCIWSLAACIAWSAICQCPASLSAQPQLGLIEVTSTVSHKPY